MIKYAGWNLKMKTILHKKEKKLRQQNAINENLRKNTTNKQTKKKSTPKRNLEGSKNEMKSNDKK